ncbi:hypothetical protein N9D17_00345, partial [bacterium]|nr:hypothetical protein [bacterium]
MSFFKKVSFLLSIIFITLVVGVLIGEYNILEFRKTTHSFYSNGYQFYKNSTTKIEIPKMSLEIDDKSFQKIKNKRDSALIKRYMTNTKKDYVPVNIFWNQKKKKGKLRLKGGFTDHYNDEKKWSFRIKLKEDSTRTMKSFALQHPKTRHYLNEWIFQQYIAFIGLINIDYDFIKLDLNGKNLGIYAMEESFTDRLLINKKLPIGPILKLDKGKFILDYKDECAVETKDWFQFSNDEYLNAKIELYNKKHLEEDSAFSNSFKKA